MSNLDSLGLPRLTVVDGHTTSSDVRRSAGGSEMTQTTPPKLCALVIRVSTDNQAKNPEGSLKNQLQRLRAHIEYKTNTCGENWVEAQQYVLPGISGKKSFHSKQFQQLFEDIRSGKVNT